jgi:hypothetical protein
VSFEAIVCGEEVDVTPAAGDVQTFAIAMMKLSGESRQPDQSAEGITKLPFWDMRPMNCALRFYRTYLL